ncbi:glucosamine-6-phosphate deaminase [Eubacterium sp. am_0171]|uniref:Glucosamine-6-phosphate deaminase n=1 Tax=Faecalicatena contorta TaxID=39482 RepID=A0A174D477_9FIRM|nr:MULTISPECIES: glucosamine-6-phosphate deaminase [Clostridia]MSC84160.1 glucosamine-6-phosphate deaminase [Eubacterium sp. BIOML-A1]MSD06584.1 glucosamine-6-phosphate deaminase [Eubacterium sp. BIOML-A2]RYT18864.1 glucosamine-6-phosphate deaminase [Eubacterium sp. am_0171]CUO20334.1 Glucosamine-6-phosphate deaminase 1 [[Eubacterium] contortum] [Faecalicatena contorta]
MKIYRTDNYEEMSKKAANILAAQITWKPDSVLGLATGSSPVGMYQYLAEKYEMGDLDFSEVRTANLDDYKGLKKMDPLGYRYYMEEHLFSRVNIRKENTYIPDSSEEDSARACADYDDVLSELGPADIQVLGLGHDGHIGFNEPFASFSEHTQCVDLNEATIQANKRFFEKEEEVPRQAYTMGIGTIMKAKMILLLVSGADKAEILQKVLSAEVTPQIPGTILRFHPNVILIADKDALP